jgi:mycofactocin system glycosyltransferase
MGDDTPAYRLNAHVRRSAGGRILTGGRPPRLLRLSAAGAEALDEVLAGRPGPGADGLVRRLLAHGMLDPIPGARAEVTFVVPVRDGGPEISRLVEQLVPYGTAVVVDDRSTDDSAARARAAGATVVANAEEAGPGGARNTGWRLAATEFVAFIDADCQVEGDWARPLAGLLAADPELALVAPRVRGIPGTRTLARWERDHSALDMGAGGGLVGPGRSVAFVPSAALVARRSALVELDGFAAELRFGEDVDLCWRAVAAGHRVRYTPEVCVHHPPRRTLTARVRQRFEYGTSAAELERRHPGAAAPLRPGRMTLPTALLGAGSPAGALLAAAGVAAFAASRQADAPARLAIARLALDGELTAGREFARAAAREWLPLTLLALALTPRTRRFALFALAVDLIAATRRRTTPTRCLLRLADNAAYGAGVWHGALAHRSPNALLPKAAGG